MKRHSSQEIIDQVQKHGVHWSQRLPELLAGFYEKLTKWL